MLHYSIDQERVVLVTGIEQQAIHRSLGMMLGLNINTAIVCLIFVQECQCYCCISKWDV